MLTSAIGMGTAPNVRKKKSERDSDPVIPPQTVGGEMVLYYSVFQLVSLGGAAGGS